MYRNRHNPFQEEEEKWILLVKDCSPEQLKLYASGDGIIRTFSKGKSNNQSFLYALLNEKTGYIGQSGPKRLHNQQRDRHSKKGHPADLISRNGNFDVWVCVLDNYPRSRRDELLEKERYYIDKYKSILNLINDEFRKSVEQNISNPPGNLLDFFNVQNYLTINPDRL